MRRALVLLLSLLLAGPALAAGSGNIPSKFQIPWGNSAGVAYIRVIPQASQIGIQNCAASLTDGFPPLTFVPASAGGCPPFGADFNGILKQITQWAQWQAMGGAVPWDSAYSASIGGYPKGALVASAGSATFTGTGSGTNLTTSAVTGIIGIGNAVTGTGVPAGTYIVSQTSGTLGGAGVYVTNNATTSAAASLTSSGLGQLWLSAVDNNASNPDLGGGNWQQQNFGSSGVAFGTYTRAKVTVTADGRVTSASSGAQPTYQRFTSGSGTATPAAGVVRWRITLSGGGGSGSNTATAGNAGGSTTLGSGGAQWTAVGGSGGASAGTGGAGGTGGVNGSPGTLILRLAGGAGSDGMNFIHPGGSLANPLQYCGPVPGGANPLGGGPGHTPAPNTGAGSATAGNATNGCISVGNGVAGVLPGAGGAGEWVSFQIVNPGAMAYSVGAGGAAITSVAAGAAGIVLIEEFYD